MTYQIGLVTFPCFAHSPQIWEESEEKPQGRGYSTGTHARDILTSSFTFDKIFLTGFIFFGLSSENSNHYFGKPELEMAWHDVNQEIKVFAAIRFRFPGEVEKTPEVEAALIQGSDKPHGEKPRGFIPFRLNRWLANRLIRTAYRLRRLAKD